MIWKELVEIIKEEKDLAKLSRNEEQQRDYEIFRYHLKQQFKSVGDYILCSKFGHDKTREHGLWLANPQLSNVSTSRKILAPNDFPYFTDKGITHYILWKTKSDINQQDIADAEVELRSRMEVADILHWVNPPHLKSIPEIDHVHYLCLLDVDEEI